MTPEQEEALQRALRRQPDPEMPPEVRSRLEETLESLARERATGPCVPSGPSAALGPSAQAAHEPPAATTVHELADRRRRQRRWSVALVAAVSLGVLGIGVGVVLGQLDGSGEMSTSAGSAADDTAGAPETTKEQGGDDSQKSRPDDSGAEQDSAQGGGSVAERTTASVLVQRGRALLRADTLAADVARLLDPPGARAPLVGAADDSGPRITRTRELLNACRLPETEPGDLLVAARFAQERATLVVRRASNSSREAEVYACNTPGQPMATTTVPTP